MLAWSPSEQQILSSWAAKACSQRCVVMAATMGASHL